MSFMFKPYPYDDMSALNQVAAPAEAEGALLVGVEAVARALADLAAAPLAAKRRCVVALDGYVGAEFPRLAAALAGLASTRGVAVNTVAMADAYRDSAALEAMLADSLPMERDIDPVLLFGTLIHRELESLFDEERLAALRARLAASTGLTILAGQGSASAALDAVVDVRAFLDVTPMNAALQVRAGRARALGDTAARPLAQTFRRLYYYDFEILVAHRARLIRDRRLDLYVDANRPDGLKALPLAAFRSLLDALAGQPFRCKPVYLEGVWGGQFIKRLRGLPPDMKNCAWVFDLIPNEVSVLARFAGGTVEIPFPTVFRAVPERLMGGDSVARFGAQFPIRFNYDDTYDGGGNMSVQVHPPADYAKRHFGEPFQQDESYYVVETGGSKTYLGFRDDADVGEFLARVRTAENERTPFDYEQYINAFASRRGDQFLLPGGTVHASGRNQVVLEIGSCTVGSYTFKLYDYLRADLDGVPRPIHSRHGAQVLDPACRRSSADGVLKPAPRVLRAGRGWREVLLGEHERIFFSLRRLEFERSVQDDTAGRFHVLVLVEGEEVLVYSLDDPSRCYRQRRCDMVVVPASLGRYGIQNLGGSPCAVTKTLLK